MNNDIQIVEESIQDQTSDGAFNLSSAPLIQVMQAVAAGISTDGWHDHFKYHYASIGQVRRAVNPALREAGLAILPSVTGVARHSRPTANGGTIMVTAVRLRIHIIDQDGVAAVVDWLGESEDCSASGIPKAISQAMKSFLINTFLIPVNESEEEGGRPVRRPRGAAVAGKQSGPKREDLLARWQGLAGQAKARGIPVTALPPDASVEEIIAQGRALAARLASEPETR